MKKLLFALLLAAGQCFAATSTPISGLPAATAISSTDTGVVVQGGATKKFAISLLNTAANGGTGLSSVVTGLLIGNGTIYGPYTGTSCTNQFPRSLSASGVATCASVALASDISGFGTGVATFLATPSSANFAAAITDEVGTGSVLLGAEGTWTPTILIGGVEPTSYETRYGSYTRVGNRVCVNARVQILVVGAATGSVTIGGLPATSKDITYNQTAMSILAFALTGLTTESLQAQITNNATEIQIMTFTLGTVTAMPHTKLAADAGFIVGGCYPI